MSRFEANVRPSPLTEEEEASLLLDDGVSCVIELLVPHTGQWHAFKVVACRVRSSRSWCPMAPLSLRWRRRRSVGGWWWVVVPL